MFCNINSCYENLPPISNFYENYKSSIVTYILKLNFPNYEDLIKPLFLKKKHNNPIFINKLLEAYYGFFQIHHRGMSIQQVYSEFFNKKFYSKNWIPQEKEKIYFEKLCDTRQIPGRICINYQNIAWFLEKKFEFTQIKIEKLGLVEPIVHGGDINTFLISPTTRNLKILDLSKSRSTIESFSHDNIEEFSAFGNEHAVYQLPKLKILSFYDDVGRSFSDVFPLSQNIESIKSIKGFEKIDMFYANPLKYLRRVDIEHSNLPKSNFFKKNIQSVKFINIDEKFCSRKLLNLSWSANLSLQGCRKLSLCFVSFEKYIRNDNILGFLRELNLEKLKVRFEEDSCTYVSNIVRFMDVAPHLEINGVFLKFLSEENKEKHYILKNPTLLRKLIINITDQKQTFESPSDKEFLFETLMSLSNLEKIDSSLFTSEKYIDLYKKESLGKISVNGDFDYVLRLLKMNMPVYKIMVYIDFQRGDIERDKIEEFCEYIARGSVKDLVISFSAEEGNDLYVGPFEIIVSETNNRSIFFRKFLCYIDTVRSKFFRNKFFELERKYIMPQMIYC